MSQPVRRLLIAVSVSVGLNLFFLGVFAARALRGNEARRAPVGVELRNRGPRRAPGLGWIPREERKRLRAQRRALHELRKAAEKHMRAEPFDPARLRASLAAIRQETEKTQAAVHEVLVQSAERMSATERQALATRSWGLGRSGRPKKKRGRRRDE